MIQERYEIRVKETALEIETLSRKIGFEEAVKEVRGQTTLPDCFYRKSIERARECVSTQYSSFLGGLFINVR